MSRSRINPVAKGDALVRQAVDLLLRDGYRVYAVRKVRVRKRTGWISLGEDIFGAFDAVATRSDGIRFVQVTVVDRAAEHRRRIDALPLPDGGTVSYEVWAWHERLGWRVYRRTARGVPGRVWEKAEASIPYPPSADTHGSADGNIFGNRGASARR